MKKLSMLFLLIAILMPSVFCQVDIYSIDNDLLKDYLFLEDATYNFDISYSDFLQKSKELSIKLQNISDSKLIFYWKSKIVNLQGIQAYRQNKKQEADVLFTESAKLAESANKIGEFSEGYGMMSEAKTQLMLLRGVLYIIQEGANTEALADKALSLDATNVRALIIKAYGRINAPAIFGGDPKKGIALLNTFISKSDLSKSEAFLLHYGIALGQIKLGESKSARASILKALEIYPNNKDALAVFKSL